MTAAKIPRWVDKQYNTSNFEAWIYRNSTWSIIPFQIDELGERPEDLKPFVLQPSPRLVCNGNGAIPPTTAIGPCEFLYDLRGANEPGGYLSTNDELVFVAGMAGDCSAPLSPWPEGFDVYRQKIVIKDGTEAGCVYLFRRVGGTRPTFADLVHYDPVGDGEPASCIPYADTCGAITADAADVDGDGTTDLAAYRFDFRGNWQVDKYRIGGTTVDPTRDLVDVVKTRCLSPAETERAWDQQEPTGPMGQLNNGCAYFAGYIDGPVRVVRVIQGSMSGATTRKLEFAYPGEIASRMYHRVHRLSGPEFIYFDLLQANVSGSSGAKIYKEGFTGQTPFDVVDGAGPANVTFTSAENWYQLSSELGSFLQYHGDEQYYGIRTRTGRYDDLSTKLWAPDYPAEYESEVGDRAALRTEWSGLLDTQNLDACVDPRGDGITAIGELTTVVLASTSAAPDAGSEEVGRRNRGPLSQCIEEEQASGGGGGGPCVPTLVASYGHNSGPVELSIVNCQGILGWNLYQVLGGGVLRRLATLGPGDVFLDVNLELNEQRTYRASTLTGDCAEGTLSSTTIIIHDDTVGPTRPTNVVATSGTGSITVSWVAPRVGDVNGFIVLAAEQSGGPYTPAHSGILDRLADSLTFQAVGGPKTYYLIVRAVDNAGNTGDPSLEVSVTVP